jgi:Predicted membrane protein
MSELKRNLTANLKRYTNRGTRTEYITKIAIYTALSFVLYIFVKFPLPFLFPSFLDIQISELPALIAGFSMGPISGCLVIVLKCILKFPMSTTGCVGELTDILLGVCFVIPSSLIYHSGKSKKSALIGLIVGAGALTAVSLLVNRYISIPVYTKIMPFTAILNAVAEIYEKVTIETFYSYYLFLCVLPFNVLRCMLVSLFTFLLYPRLQRPLRLEITDLPPDKIPPEVAAVLSEPASEETQKGEN